MYIKHLSGDGIAIGSTASPVEERTFFFFAHACLMVAFGVIMF